MSGFRICNNKGFHITFPNGVVLSTQFGGGNYCENRNDSITRTLTEGKACINAEVAAYRDPNGAWVTKEVFAAAGLESPGDDVAGWIDVDDWLKIANACAALAEVTEPVTA